MHGGGFALGHDGNLLVVEPHAVPAGGTWDLEKTGVAQVLHGGAAGKELPRHQRLRASLQEVDMPAQTKLFPNLRRAS